MIVVRDIAPKCGTLLSMTVKHSLRWRAVAGAQVLDAGSDALQEALGMAQLELATLVHPSGRHYLLGSPGDI
jgi:hypothetical protein